MPGHFDSIGFVAEKDEDLLPFVKRALREGDQLEVIGADPGWGGRYVCWSPGSGVQLWVNVDEKGKVQSFDPHYQGRGRAHITLERSYDYDTAPPTGGVFAWVALGSNEETKAGFDLPGFARFYDMACDYEGNALVQVAAFAHGAAAFPDVESYRRAQEEIERENPELAFDVQSFLPIGYFDPEGNIPPATARLSGIILEAQRLTNPVTGRQFHAVLVKTVGMTVDVVADDEQLEGDPQPGGVLAGAFWMSAVPAEGPRRATMQMTRPAKITITGIRETEPEPEEPEPAAPDEPRDEPESA
jgi:hypothetical protein